MAERDISSKRPYLLRAMHEWMSDNGLTPHIVVDARREGVAVPAQHVDNGKIILNVSYEATEGLDLGNDRLAFSARFGGVSQVVTVPTDAVLGIYARESGEGMIFAEEDAAQAASEPDDGGDDGPPRGHLKVVK